MNRKAPKVSTSGPEDPGPYPWLPLDKVLRWLQVDPADTVLGSVVEDCRKAAADYCQDQRGDLWTDPQLDGTTSFEATDRIVQAGLLAAARLFARRSSPAGLASYGEFGATEVLRLDPDVERLLGVGRYAAPVIG